MTTQIDLLATLQQIDQRLQQKERDLQELRQQVMALSEQKATKEREAEEQRQRIATLETSHRAVERQLREEEEKIKEKHFRRNRIRNQRELDLLNMEVTSLREAKGKLEEEILTLMEQIEQENTRLTQTQVDIETLTTRITQETTQVEAQIAALEQETRQERAEREKVVRSVDADLCARYERLFAKRGGLALVEIRAGTCQGCHMRIPPHMCNQIQSNYMQHNGAIFQCPHCGRILYWRMVPEETPDA